LAGTSKSAAASIAGGAGPPTSDPIDRRYLARFTLDNTDLEREVLELFAGQMPLYLTQLRASATAKAWKEAAHTIKGSAAAVGAFRLARMAELAEKIVVEHRGTPGNARENAVTAVAEAIEEACRHIARLFPKA